MSDFLCTTVLEYPDRHEGQVMHRGDKRDCDKVAEMIPAVAIGDGETPISASIVVAPVAEFGDLESGTLWRAPKEAPAPA